jgi:hypothetical protein
MDLARASFNWHRIHARAVDAYFMGVDIGQSSDPTAICVLQHRVIPLETWTRNDKAETWKQDRQMFFDVRPLGKAADRPAVPGIRSKRR